MSFDVKKHKDKLLFLPLGGAEEIGMNLNLYHYKGKWIIVDMGIGFADEFYSGIDVLVPNIQFILDNKKDFLGIVLTHAHEDHIGALQYLWNEIGCDIYATKFASTVVRSKFSENGIAYDNNIREVSLNHRFTLGPFDIEMVGITHSIPEMHGLMIRTDMGNVFHTGDWKFDNDPMIGDTTNEKKLKDLGKEGILAVVSDSTNVFNKGHSRSEGELYLSLKDIISKCQRGVVVTTFASNVARLHSIIKIAENCGRKVVLLGRSLWRIYNASLESGYLQDMSKCITDKEALRFNKDKLLFIATGCQGEPLAATNKLVNNVHPTVSLERGDTVVFSCKFIPGNEKKIFYMLNKFCRNGINVMTEKQCFVHVSGHPSRDEIKKMYSFLKPKIVIPVHGESVHIHEHAKFAIECGISSSLEPYNGAVLHITPNQPKIIDEVEGGLCAIDGYFILPSPGNNTVIKSRRIMRDNGAIIITLLFSDGMLIKDPIILTPGVLDVVEDTHILHLISKDILNIVKMNKIENIERIIRQSVRKFLRKEIGKEPLILVKAIE